MVGDTLAVGPGMTDETNLDRKSSVTGGTSVSRKGEDLGTVCTLLLYISCTGSLLQTDRSNALRLSYI